MYFDPGSKSVQHGSCIQTEAVLFDLHPSLCEARNLDLHGRFPPAIFLTGKPRRTLRGQENCGVAVSYPLNRINLTGSDRPMPVTEPKLVFANRSATKRTLANSPNRPEQTVGDCLLMRSLHMLSLFNLDIPYGSRHDAGMDTIFYSVVRNPQTALRNI